MREYIHTDISTMHSYMLTHICYLFHGFKHRCIQCDKIYKDTHNYNTTILQNLLSVSHGTLTFYSVQSAWFCTWELSSRIPKSFIHILNLTKHIGLTTSTEEPKASIVFSGCWCGIYDIKILKQIY